MFFCLLKFIKNACSSLHGTHHEASWCVPCKDEHAFLMNLSKQKNIKIIGINYKDKNKNAINFLKELSSPYQTVLLDMDGTLAIEWGAPHSIASVPSISKRTVW